MTAASQGAWHDFGGSCAVFFSGGKDSTLALDRATRAGLRVASLLTLYDDASSRVRFHATAVEVMRAQAEALSLPTRLHATTPASFEDVARRALAELRSAGIEGVVFGDIHLADVRAWYEERTQAAGLAHIEPLWGEDPERVARDVVALGYRAIITCVEDATADASWLGQPLAPDLIDAFVRRGIDPAGERGEYHTFVVDGPLFQHTVAVTPGAVHREGGFTQLDLQLAR